MFLEQAFTVAVWALAIAIGGPVVLAAIIGTIAFLYVIIDDITSRRPNKKHK